MNLLKKIFPISAKFVGSTKKLILGALIYLAIILVSIPLMFVFSIGNITAIYADIGLLVMLLMHFGAFSEDDTMGDVFRKVFPLSYKFSNCKEKFVGAIIAHVIAILLTSFGGYALVGLILLIVDYCKNNKKEKAADEVPAAEAEKAEEKVAE